jgi:hypothetical protein
VAFNSEGTLAIATSTLGPPPTTSAVAQPVTVSDAAVPTVEISAVGVSAAGTQFLASQSQTGFQVVAASPDAAASAAPAQLSTTNLKLFLGQPVTALGSGAVLAPTTNGFLESDADDNVLSNTVFPQFDCSGISVTPQAGSATPDPASTECQEAPTSYAVDGSGDIWLTTNASDTSLEELADS